MEEIQHVGKREPGDSVLSPPNACWYSSAGAIPAQLGALKELTRLDLTCNQLGGEKLMTIEVFCIVSNIFMCPVPALA